MTSRLLLGMAVACALAIGLAGCAPHSDPGNSAAQPAKHPGATASKSASAHPAATPTSAGLPAGALLRVTALATAKDGSSARIVLTAMSPTNGDGSESAAMTAAQCDDSPWQTDLPAPRQWVRMTETSTVVSGSSWPLADAIGVWGGSGLDWSAWTGAWSTFEAYCSTGIATVPGDATGLAPVATSASASNRASWLGTAWGFSWFDDGDGQQPFTFTSCSVELGAVAQPYASALTRTPPEGGTAADDTCLFGPSLD